MYSDVQIHLQIRIVRRPVPPVGDLRLCDFYVCCTFWNVQFNFYRFKLNLQTFALLPFNKLKPANFYRTPTLCGADARLVGGVDWGRPRPKSAPTHPASRWVGAQGVGD